MKISVYTENQPDQTGCTVTDMAGLSDIQVTSKVEESSEDVTVTADAEDPTRCLVEFAFTVAHGLNQIWLTAHITV